VLRGSTLQFSALKNKQLKTQQKFLEHKMQLLQNRLGCCSANCRDSLFNEIENCQNELENEDKVPRKY